MAEPIEYTPREEEQLFRDLNEASTRVASYTSTASPQFAGTAGRYASQFPNADPGVLLGVTEAVSAGLMSGDDGYRTLREATEISVSDPERHVDNGGNKSLFRRAWDTGAGALKTASKYTFAGLNTTLQLVQNASSRLYALDAPGLVRGAEKQGLYKKPETGFFDGWFASTDLGALFAGKDSGDGWFIGDAAYEYQQQQVLRYRGGFLDDAGNVTPFTLGRTVATMFAHPNSSAWNVWSGAIDAAVALRVAPIPGTKIAGVARQGKLGEDAARLAQRLPVIKQYAGLTEGSSRAINTQYVPRFLNSSDGRRLNNFLATQVNDVPTAANLFDGKVDINILSRIAETTDPNQMRLVLEDVLGVTPNNAGFGITSIDQLPKISVADRFRTQFGQTRLGQPRKQAESVREQSSVFNRVTEGMVAEGRRLRAKSLPNRAWAISFEDGFASTEAIRDMDAMLDLFRVPKNGRAFSIGDVDFTRAQYMDELVRHAMDPNAGNLKRIVDMTNEVIVEGVVNTSQLRLGRDPDALRDATRAMLKQHEDVQDKFYGFIGDDGFATNFALDPGDVARGLLDDTLETGEAMISPPQFRTVNNSTGEVVWNVAPVGTAGLSSEMMRQMIVLPNMQSLRRATSRISFLFEKKGFDWTQTSLGEANALTTMLDAAQTKVWRPMAMMTGGYVTRNIADSLLRQTLAPGIKSGPSHPLRWISLMSNKKNVGSILARSWDQEYSRADLDDMGRRIVDAVGNGARDLEPGKRNLLGWRRSAWAVANFPVKGRATKKDIDIYARAIADNMFLLSNDPLVRYVANGVPWEQVAGSAVRPGLDEIASDLVPSLMRDATERGEAFDLPNSIKTWLLETSEGRQRAKQMQNMWKNKTPVAEGSGTRFDYSFYDEATNTLDDANWQTYLNDYIQARIDAVTGGNESLSQILLGSPDGMPKIRVVKRYKGGEIVRDKNNKIVYSDQMRKVPLVRKAGEPITDSQGNFVYRYVDAYKKVYVEPGVSDAVAGYSDEMMEEIRGIVVAAMDNPDIASKLSKSLKYQIDEMSDNDTYFKGVKESWDRLTTHFFGSVYGLKEAKLNRSPAFREFYYELVSQTIPAMRQEDALYVINRLLFQHDGKPREYLEALQKARTKKVGGETLYRVPEGVSEMSKFLGSGRWVDTSEYEKLVAEATETVKNLTSRMMNSDDVSLLLKSFNDKNAAEQLAAKFDTFSAQWGSNFMGGKDRFRALVEQATKKISMEDQTKMLSAEQIDFAAKSYAVEATKKMFYDASNKSNFADIAQIISPFGTSWAELIKTYSREMMKTPMRARNAGGIAQGVSNATTSNDARGFLYRDPNTDELMFNFPFSSELLPIISGFGGYVAGQTLFGVGRGKGANVGAGVIGALSTAGLTRSALTKPGIETQVGAPVRSLSLALPLGPTGQLNLIPGFGPVVQITATQILGNKPQYRDYMEKIAPYGAEQFSPRGVASQFTPAWADKLFTAITADPRTDERFADIYMDTLRALSASGDFDLTNPTEKQAMVNRAKDYAKSLMIYASIGQFTGPVRPKIDFVVPVEFEGTIDSGTLEGLKVEGHIPTNFLSSIYRSFQEEDFENAPLRFIETFGPNTLLYTAPGTVTAEGVKGLGVSRSFGDWEGENADLAQRYPQVFGYFAPTGTDFDYQTYLRQLKTNQRSRVVDPELLIASAEAVVGKSLYRAFRRSQGTVQSEFNETLAGQYRELLYKQYPGFANEALNLNELDATINRLQGAVYDPALDMNEAAIAMRLYFDRRDAAINLSRSRRQYDGRPIALGSPLSSVADTDLRIQLRFFGEKLSREYPQFERVWSRELFDEVDA